MNPTIELLLPDNFNKLKTQYYNLEIKLHKQQQKLQPLKGFRILTFLEWEEDAEKDIEDVDVFMYLIKLNSKYIGIMEFRCDSELNCVRVSLLYLENEYRQKGIMTKLVQERLKFFEENRYSIFSIVVLKNNERAKHLYEKLGFTVDSFNMIKTL